jgi:hypothetical protein
MQLEADYGGTLNCGNVYLWNGREYITSNPAMVVVVLMLFISDRHLFEEIR